MRTSIFLVLLLLLVGTVNGQVYKWVDQNGKVQYSDQPPPPGGTSNQKMLEIQSSSHATSEDEGAIGNSAEREQTFKEKRAAREDARNKQLAEANMKKENCLTAQSNLDLLKHSERLSVPDGSGGVIDVDDHLRQKYMDEALKNIAMYCQQ